MSTLISKALLGRLNGGAQDDVEMAIARNTLKLEAEMGQPKNTLNIPRFVAALNEKHALVPEEKVPVLAANVERAYAYISEQKALSISRAGYKSYAADEAVKNVRHKVKHIADVARDALSKPRPA
jgi:hypothetical protein